MEQINAALDFCLKSALVVLSGLAVLLLILIMAAYLKGLAIGTYCYLAGRELPPKFQWSEKDETETSEPPKADETDPESKESS